MRVFVTGGTGHTGSYIIPELIAAGHEVTGLARSDTAAAAVSALGAKVRRGTLGDTVRFDPRRVRIPVLPIEDQRTHGAAFRRLADLARTLRAAHDEGNALIHDLIDATVSSISAAPELQR
jgi:nucleoside-diphosphate-sugar epimerase